MSGSPDVNQRVPGFLYLDMERVKSISARIDQGYIKERVEEQEESEEVAASIYGSIKAQIFGAIGPSAEAGADVSGSLQSGSRSQESKALHHYYYDLLEEWLNEAEGDWFHDVDEMRSSVGGDSALPGRFRSDVSEGDLIRASGTLTLSDFRTSLDLMEGFFEAIDLLEEFQTEAIREQLSGGSYGEMDLSDIGQMGFTEFKSMEPLFNTFQRVIPDDYRQMIVSELSPSEDMDFVFWSTIPRETMESTPVELLSKHQESQIPNCTILARVESITSEGAGPDEDELDEMGEDEEFEFGELLHVADSLGSEFGLKVDYPAISVSPIAIYR